MIKLVATDIDGTIVKWGQPISDRVKKSVKNLVDLGVKVVLVTGRMHCATVPVAQELGISSPIISYQGGLIKDMTGKTLYQIDLPSKKAIQIIEWARTNKVHINLYIDDKLYVEQDNEIVKYYTNGKFINYEVKSFDDIDIKNVNKILAIDLENPDLVTKWENELKLIYPSLTIVKSTPYFCEIGAGNAKKSLGVKFLCDMWGINKNEVLTIGDQNNDIDLIQAGGIGVAMGNGTEALIKCADFVTDTVDNDGFAVAVEKFILEGVKNV